MATLLLPDFEVLFIKKFTLPIIKKSIITKIRSRHQTKVPLSDFGSTAVAIIAMILVSATAMAQPPTGNLLSDADFSSNTVLAPFGSSIESQWKDEDAQIAIGTVEGINPLSPDGMLQLNETSLVVSQVRQSIDVSAYASEIDLGMVSAVARAFYNCPTEACNATLSIRNTATRLQHLQDGITAISPLNGDPEVWQEANVGLSKPVVIPPGTRSIDIEVAFSNGNGGSAEDSFQEPQETNVGLSKQVVIPLGTKSIDIEVPFSTGTIPNGGFVDDAFLGLRFSQCEAQGDGIAGETVQINYKGLEPDQEILAFLGSGQVLEGEFADANGEGTIQLPIPSDTPEGTHLITIEHDGLDLTAACSVKTLPPPSHVKACDHDAPGVNVIIGTEKFDYLRGTSGDDVIIALGGNDIIIGGGGNDCIDGGEGRDLIVAREGDDTIFGGPGNDLIHGNGGADIISGGAGNDTIFGSAGDDTIDGNEGEDKIFGGSGTDACANGVLTQCERPIIPAGLKTIPTQWVVVLRDTAVNSNGATDAVRELAERLISEATARTRNKSNVSNSLGFVYSPVLNGFSATLSDEAVAVLINKPEVLYILPDAAVELDSVQSPTPSWGINRIDQISLPLDQVYSYNNTGDGVHAYIIDTGINLTHQEFTGRIGNGVNYADNIPGDCHGHGTHVAGTLGGATYGVAKGVTLHAIKVFDCVGNSTIARILAGVNWVTVNRISPAVVNMSLGIEPNIAAVDTAVKNSIASDLLYVLSAGNTNIDACNRSPQTVLSAITVGSTDINDNRSIFSNIGSCLDIFAPGSSITSAWIDNDTATRTIDGTSMAAPHVAGAAALFLQQDPSKSVTEITNTIINFSSKNKVKDIGLFSPNTLVRIQPMPPLNPRVKLYEGNNATQRFFCSLDVSFNQTINFKKHFCINDEARSAVLTEIKAGTVIEFYDKPKCTKNDDWTRILVKNTIAKLTISTFQQTFSSSEVAVTYHSHSNGPNALDGKVSCIKIVVP